MDKYLERNSIPNRASRPSATPDTMECDAASTASAGSSQDDLEHPWPHLTNYYGPIKTKERYTEGSRVMYKGKIECTQCKKAFSFDTKAKYGLKQHYSAVSNYE